MTSKILRIDGVTELANIKPVIYTETVNAGEGLRPGCVASSSITVECFGSQSDAPAQDEALTYYQVVNGVETLVGIFYAEPSIPSKGTYKFVAYDSVAKLDVDFSARLNAIQDDFPMSIYDLVSEACSVAGVTLGSSSWPLSTQTVQAFYADNLTCRNILQYAAEIACRFVRCNTSGEVIFDWYTTNSTGIYPGGNDNTKVAYKQNGLTYDNTNVYVVDSVAIKPSGVEGAAYIYPTSVGSLTATDPNGDGNIIITNVLVTDSGSGNILMNAEAEDENADGNVDVIGSASQSVNPLILGDNLLLTNASDVTYLAVAQNIYNVMSALPTYRHSTSQLFVDENPFHAGEFVSVTDAQGVSFTTPVFTMTVSASGANLVSSGKAKYQMETTTSLAKSVANLASNIVQIDKLKVGWAEIQEAIVQYLKLYGLLTVYTDDTLSVSGGALGYGTTTYKPTPYDDFVTEDGIALLSLNAASGWDGESQPTDTTLLVTDSGVKVYSNMTVSGEATIGGVHIDYDGVKWSESQNDLYKLTAHDGYGHWYGGYLSLEANLNVPGNVGGATLSGYGVGGGSLSLTDSNGTVFLLAKDIRKTLLWSNGDQSTFAATTLTSTDFADDLSNYNCFIINCHQKSNAETQIRYVTTVCNMKDAALADAVMFNAFDVALETSYHIAVRQRTFIINRSANTIAISTGYYGDNGTSGGSYTSTMVPISIYGMNI